MTWCPWDHLLQKGAVGSKAGRREKGSCMQADHLGLGWGVRWPLRTAPRWAKLASPLCLPPSTTVTLNEMQPRPSLQAWRWKLSALPAAGRTLALLRELRAALHSGHQLRTPTRTPSAVGRVRFTHPGGCRVVCHCACHAVFL